MSASVQALPSAQAVPSAFASLEHMPVAVSHVRGWWHWSDAPQVTGFDPAQTPQDPWISSVSALRLSAATQFARVADRDLRSAIPHPERGTWFLFHNVPGRNGYLAGDGAAIRLLYGDKSLAGGYVNQLRPYANLDRPMVLFVVNADGTRLVETALRPEVLHTLQLDQELQGEIPAECDSVQRRAGFRKLPASATIHMRRVGGAVEKRGASNGGRCLIARRRTARHQRIVAAARDPLLEFGQDRRRQHCPDPAVVGDHSTVGWPIERDVQVGADEDALPSHVAEAGVLPHRQRVSPT